MIKVTQFRSRCVNHDGPAYFDTDSCALENLPTVACERDTPHNSGRF
jgi:hypothetical protein